MQPALDCVETGKRSPVVVEANDVITVLNWRLGSGQNCATMGATVCSHCSLSYIHSDCSATLLHPLLITLYPVIVIKIANFQRHHPSPPLILCVIHYYKWLCFVSLPPGKLSHDAKPSPPKQFSLLWAYKKHVITVSLDPGLSRAKMVPDWKKKRQSTQCKSKTMTNQLYTHFQPPLGINPGDKPKTLSQTLTLPHAVSCHHPRSTWRTI